MFCISFERNCKLLVWIMLGVWFKFYIYKFYVYIYEFKGIFFIDGY